MATPIALLPRASVEPLLGYVDGYHTENHRASVRTLTYPVERGSDLTDHAVRDPIVIQMSGWTSDLLPAAHANQETDLRARASAAWAEILRIMDEREPVPVVTLLGDYDSMLIIDADAPVEQETGRALSFTMTLKEVRFADQLDRGLLVVPVEGSPAEDRVNQVDQGRTVPEVTSNAHFEYYRELLLG